MVLWIILFVVVAIIFFSVICAIGQNAEKKSAEQAYLQERERTAYPLCG